MKITELTKTRRQELKESLEQTNDSGFATKDLMQIYDTHVKGNWDCVDFDEEMARLDAMIAEDHASTSKN